MHRFWPRFIEPVIETLAPAQILALGAGSGRILAALLTYCRSAGAELDIVDPAPGPALLQMLEGYRDVGRHHARNSLEAIAQLPAVELVLLDDDPNWFSVYGALQQLYLRAAICGQAPPVILLGHTAWPYARRDMYANPAGIDIADRHPYAYRGMLPGQSALSDAGFNGGVANAVHEGGPRNGVLTAVEDFCASCGIETSLHLLPFHGGLGLLVPAARMTPALRRVIEGFFSAESLLETCRILEQDAMQLRAERAALETVLANRSAALARARELIEAPPELPITARAWRWARQLRLRIANSQA